MRGILIVAIVVLSACVSEPLPDGFKDSDDFDPVAAAKNRISLGLTYLQNGNFSQAKFNLDKALQFAPRLADAHFSMAYYYQQVDESELADDAYQKAIAFAPKNPDIANSYGAFLCAKGDYKEAKKYFLKAVNSSNYISTAETYENLALCSQSQGQIDDALTYLQSAINHQPSRGKSLLLLVELQMQQQQWQAAKDNLRRYEKVARVTPDTLWKSIEIENALNNISLAKGYGDMLVRMYPRHPRTLAYIKNKREFTNVDRNGKITRQLKPSANVSAPAPSSVVQVPGSVEEQVSSSVNEKPTTVAAVKSSNVEVSEEVPDLPPELNVITTEMPVTQTELEQPPVESASDVDPIVPNNQDDDATEGPQLADAQTPMIGEQSDMVGLEEADTLIETTVTDNGEISVNTADLKNVDSLNVSKNKQGDSIEQIHEVQKGENLYRISLRYNVKMKRLLEWNGLQEGEAIPIGKRLMVVDPATVD